MHSRYITFQEFSCDVHADIVSYTADNAVKLAKRLQNKPHHPVQLAADIVERALDTNGEQCSQTREHSLPWWQLSLLDVKAFLLLIVMMGLSTLALTVWIACVRAVRIAKCANPTKSKQKAT